MRCYVELMCRQTIADPIESNKFDRYAMELPLPSSTFNITQVSHLQHHSNSDKRRKRKTIR